MVGDEEPQYDEEGNLIEREEGEDGDSDMIEID